MQKRHSKYGSQTGEIGCQLKGCQCNEVCFAFLPSQSRLKSELIPMLV